MGLLLGLDFFGLAMVLLCVGWGGGSLVLGGRDDGRWVG